MGAWREVPLWTVASEVRSVADPATLGSKVFHYSIPSLEANGDGQVEKSADIRSAKLRLYGGEILISKLNPRKGRVVAVRASDMPTVCSTEFVALHPRKVDRRFLFHLLSTETTRQLLDAKVQSVTRSHQRVSPEDVMRLVVAVPELDEQRRIADFLDEHGARYDELIRRRRRQEELLAVRRLTIVDNAIRWAGPADYKLFRGLRLLRDGSHQPPPRVDSGVPLLTARNVSSGVLQLTESDTHVSEADAVEMERSLAMVPGDVLLTVKGTVGACAVVPVGFPRAVLDRNVALLRTGPNLLPEWLMHSLRSTLLQDQMRVSVSFAAQPGLPLGVIRELRLPLPLVATQRRLADDIASQCESMDRLVASIGRHVRLLLERWQALKTAAVTGQIDVTTARGVNP